MRPVVGHWSARVVLIEPAVVLNPLVHSAGRKLNEALDALLLSLAKSLFDVAAGAWVGTEVPYASRGRAMGLLETSWAMAFIVASLRAPLRKSFMDFAKLTAYCSKFF